MYYTSAYKDTTYKPTQMTINFFFKKKQDTVFPRIRVITNFSKGSIYSRVICVNMWINREILKIYRIGKIKKSNYLPSMIRINARKYPRNIRICNLEIISRSIIEDRFGSIWFHHWRIQTLRISMLEKSLKELIKTNLPVLITVKLFKQLSNNLWMNIS